MSDRSDFIKKTFQEGTFARLLWEEQMKAASDKDSRQFRLASTYNQILPEHKPNFKCCLSCPLDF